MDDYSALAERVAAGVRDMHACLILSRDGMVLGAFPDGEDAVAKPAWLRFAALGEAQRGFVEFGDQLWVFVHRGPYAAFAIASTSVRPGLLMDQLEQALLTAEEARSKREPITLPEVRSAPSGKRRVALHPTPERSIPEPAAATAEGQAATVAAGDSASAPMSETEVDDESLGEGLASDEASDPEGPDSAVEGEPAEADPPADEETEVDRVLLAKEFSGLLQVEREGDEASS